MSMIALKLIRFKILVDLNSLLEVDETEMNEKNSFDQYCHSISTEERKIRLKYSQS